MNKVYLSIPRAADQHLGSVEEDGKVYQSKIGLDELVGHVDLASGKIYERRFGPDKKVGHVDLKNGKVYHSRFGFDQYVGKVDHHGNMHRHVSMVSEEYVGKVERFVSFAHAGAAMLLLVLPDWEAGSKSEEPDQGNQAPDHSEKGSQ